MELEDQLHASLDALDVEIFKGRDYVQVRPPNVNKGIFVKEVLHALEQKFQCEVDLVICLGDDRTDESMFEAAQNYVNENPQKRTAVRFLIFKF